MSGADVIDGLVVDHESTVRVLQSGVGGQDAVVGLDDSSRHLWGGVDGELKLGLLAIVNGEALHQQGGEARASTTTEGMEDQESLKSRAVIGLKNKHSKKPVIADPKNVSQRETGEGRAQT